MKKRVLYQYFEHCWVGNTFAMWDIMIRERLLMDWLVQKYKNEMMSVPILMPQEKQPFEMSNCERIEAAGKKKEEGNRLFKCGKYRQAVKRYDKVN